MAILNHQYGLGRTVTARYFGMGSGSRVAFNLAGLDSEVAYVAPSIYTTDWQGGARTNLMRQSQTFDSLTWDKVNAGTGSLPLVTADYGVAPDGTTTADRVVFARGAGSSSGDYSMLSQASATIPNGATHSASVWMKSITGASQTVMTNWAGLTGASTTTVVTVTTSWERFTFTALSNATGVTMQIGTRGASPQGDIDILIWGAQAESGSPTSYIPTTTVVVTKYDVSPTLLYPTSRTNLAVQSQALDTAITWVPLNVTVAANAIASPDGAVTAESLTSSLANGTLLQTVLSASSTKTFSIWLMRKTGTGNIDLTLDNGVGWTTVAVTASWQRFSITQAAVLNPVFGIRIVTSSDAVYAFGGQVEEAAGMTRYIPTVAAAVPATDYSLHATNGRVTFATAPGVDATLAYKQPWAPSSNVYMRFGTGDGTSTIYGLPYAPVTPAISVAGVLKATPADYSVAPNGTVTFIAAPAGAASLTWTGAMGPMP